MYSRFQEIKSQIQQLESLQDEYDKLFDLRSTYDVRLEVKRVEYDRVVKKMNSLHQPTIMGFVHRLFGNHLPKLAILEQEKRVFELQIKEYFKQIERLDSQLEQIMEDILKMEPVQETYIEMLSTAEEHLKELQDHRLQVLNGRLSESQEEINTRKSAIKLGNQTRTQVELTQEKLNQFRRVLNLNSAFGETPNYKNMYPSVSEIQDVLEALTTNTHQFYSRNPDLAPHLKEPVEIDIKNLIQINDVLDNLDTDKATAQEQLNSIQHHLNQLTVNISRQLVELEFTLDTHKENFNEWNIQRRDYIVSYM